MVYFRHQKQQRTAYLCFGARSICSTDQCEYWMIWSRKTTCSISWCTNLKAFHNHIWRQIKKRKKLSLPSLIDRTIYTAWIRILLTPDQPCSPLHSSVIYLFTIYLFVWRDFEHRFYTQRLSETLSWASSSRTDHRHKEILHQRFHCLGQPQYRRDRSFPASKSALYLVFNKPAWCLIVNRATVILIGPISPNYGLKNYLYIVLSHPSRLIARWLTWTR